MKPFAFGKEIERVALNREIPDVWVEKDERIKKIEEILRFSGFHTGSMAGGQKLPIGEDEDVPGEHSYGSSFLEAVLYSDDPITFCSKDELVSGVGKQKIENDGLVLPDEYTFRFHDGVDRVIRWSNNVVLNYFAEYRKEYEIAKAELKDEYAVQQVLDMHAGDFLVLHNLRFEDGSEFGSVETDTLVLAPNGIFAIEVENYGDAQNDRRIAYLEKFINELLGRDMRNWAHVENIICVTDDTVTLENDSAAKQTFTRVSGLYDQLSRDKAQRFSADELNKIKRALESKSLPGKKYPIPDYSDNLRTLAAMYNSISASRSSVVMNAGLCLKDHPEFIDMIH